MTDLNIMGYHEVRGAFAASSGVVMLVSLIGVFGRKTYRLGFGPCSETEECPVVLGIIATTWPLWTIVAGTMILKEGILAYGNTTIRYWLTNEVMDRKANGAVGHTDAFVYSMVIVWKMFQTLADVVDISVIVSGDLQYVALTWLTETCVNLFGVRRALAQRRQCDSHPLLTTTTTITTMTA